MGRTAQRQVPLREREHGVRLRRLWPLGLKWVPAQTRRDTALGEVRLGLIGRTFWTRTPGERWKNYSAVLVGLASLVFAPIWASASACAGTASGCHGGGSITVL